MGSRIGEECARIGQVEICMTRGGWGEELDEWGPFVNFGESVDGQRGANWKEKEKDDVQREGWPTADGRDEDTDEENGESGGKKHGVDRYWDQDGRASPVAG